MSSPALAEGRSSRRSRVLFTLLLLLLLAGAALIAGAATWFHHAAVAALPQVDGAISVAGISGPITVLRDHQGMPHITAASQEDLFFAQGFVTAQDRMWQMDVSRRYGRGQLSEILGARTLKIDVQQRTLQIAQAVHAGIDALTPEERRYFEAYAAGVNAWMKQQAKNLPIEFRVLGYSPAPWTIEDSLVVAANISQSLNTQFPMEHQRESLIAHLTPEMIADLYVNSSWRDHPPTSAAPALPASQPDAAPAASPEPEDEQSSIFYPLYSGSDSCESCMPGSNNWVVSGAHTITGKPLLANDMHLQHSIPNVWYEVHLKSGDLDVEGVSFPGLPFVVGGHNQRIAWGYTNVGPDVQDLYIENFNSSGEYQTPSGWKLPEHHHEVIHVKRGKDVALDVQVTRHGPIVSALFPAEARKLALRWTLYDKAALHPAFLAMDRAQNWEQFRSALSNFGGAAQNVVYADVDGHIGYQATGMVPIRAAGDGLLPVSGADDAHEWTGFIPFEKLPSVFDPPSGVIATANGRIVPDGYPFLVANEWGAPYRTERIYKVLESEKKIAPSDMLALQMDTYSEFDRLCADRFVYAVDHSPHASPRARKAADLMRGWNGKVDTDAIAPTIAVNSRRKLWKIMLEPKLGDLWEKYAWFNSSVALENILMNPPARWIAPGYHDFDAMLAAAVEQAVSDPSAPADLSTWKWGPQFPVQIDHPLFSAVPVLNRYAGITATPQSGNGSLTVKAAGKSFGASERLTVNLADLDSSTLNIVTGESGQIFSPHYMDQWPAWNGGSSFNLPFSSGAVDSSAEHRLTLQPK